MVDKTKQDQTSDAENPSGNVGIVTSTMDYVGADFATPTDEYQPEWYGLRPEWKPRQKG